jgi:RNA polymerase sigma factor (sigma-70 family)
MQSGGPNSVLRSLHGLLASPRGEPADGLLLHRFATRRDEDAFAALLLRHGPMVLGLCRRLLHDGHDAEDAFQATFLLLAQKAGSIRSPALLGNWLYGVAYRVAVRARRVRARRQARERPVVDVPAPAQDAEVVWSDVRPVLDEEVNRLPDKYRVPFVLCCLEGKTNEEAASLLGSPKGTILSRLATARERLRSRLTRRGIILSAGLLATAVSRNASATVMPSLVTATARAAAAVAGEPPVSATVLTLAEEVRKAMLYHQLKAAGALVLATALAVAGALLLPSWPSSAGPPRAAAPSQPSAVKAPANSAEGAVGKNYLVFPIKTELQRALLQGYRDARTARAMVLLDGMSLVRPDGSVDSTALDFVALRRVLKPHAGKGHGLFVNVYFLAGTSADASQLVCWALEGFGRQAGFEKAQATQTRFNDRSYDWKKKTAAVGKGQAEGDEPATGDGLVKVYPVRTALSRQLTGADCVVDILPPLEGEGDGLKPAVRESIRVQVGRLNLPRKGHVLFRIRRGSGEASQRFVEATAESLAESLGFKSCSTQS